MSDKYTFLIQAPVHRVIGAMAIPNIISMLLTSMYNLVDTFFVGKIVGLGQGFQPLCGFCYGVKLYDRVKEGFRFSTKIGTFFLLFWSVILIIFSGEVVSFFRDDPNVIAIGIPALRYQMIIFSVCSFMMMANMMMQTCRKTIRANILAASRQGLFFIPLIFVLPYFYGLFGVEICQAVSDIISMIVTIPIMWSAFSSVFSQTILSIARLAVAV